MSARAGEPAGPPAENAWFDRVYRAIPLATVFVALLALYAWEAARHSTPWLFTDELELSQISRSIEATGHGGRRGDPYFWQTLYTWLIAPAWAASSTSTAYEIVKYIGVIVMTLTVVPTYFLARTIVSRRAALFAAAGAAAVPALAYAPMILEEPLSYPYAALAFLAMALALARRTWFWIAAAIALSLLGGLVRGELGVLPVVLVLAAGLYAVTSDAGRRWRSRFTVWDWVGAIVLGAGAIIVFSGLVGKFSQSWAIATGNYRGRMLDYGLHAAGSLTIGLGLLPVVGGARSPGAAAGRGAHARAARVHEPVRRRCHRLRDLHGREGVVPVHGLRDDRPGAQPDLPRAARLRRHGAVDRPAAPALDPARGGRRFRRLPDRRHAVPARQRAGCGLARSRHGPDVEPRTSRSRTAGSSAG